MQDPVPEQGKVEGISFTVRPERFAGKHWWRVLIEGNPRVLLRFREYATQVARAMAADEARFRREATSGAEAEARSAGGTGGRAPDPGESEPRPRSWRRRP
ncbi:MAG: hypothetical protein Fur0037_23930 [Planctomycetota bacterium]